MDEPKSNDISAALPPASLELGGETLRERAGRSLSRSLLKSRSRLSERFNKTKAGTLGTLIVGFLAALAVTLLFATIPLADPGAGWRQNWLFFILYPGIWSVLYTASFNCISITLFKENGRAELARAAKYVGWWWPLLSGVLNIACFVSLAAATGTFPVPMGNAILIIGSYASSLVACVAIWVHLGPDSPHRTWDVMRLLLGLLALVVGWGMALLFCAIFKQVSAGFQAALLLALVMWKYCCVLAIRSDFTKRIWASDAMSAICAAAITWFWTLYSDVVFSQVAEGWVFVLYYVVDISSVLLLSLKLTSFYSRAKLRLKDALHRWFGPGVCKPAERNEAGELDVATVRAAEVPYDASVLFLAQLGEIFIGFGIVVAFALLRWGPARKSYIVASIDDEHFRHLIFYCTLLAVGECFTGAATFWICLKYLDVNLLSELQKFLLKRRRNLFTIMWFALTILLPLPFWLVKHLDLGGVRIF